MHIQRRLPLTPSCNTTSLAGIWGNSFCGCVGFKMAKCLESVLSVPFCLEASGAPVVDIFHKESTSADACPGLGSTTSLQVP